MEVGKGAERFKELPEKDRVEILSAILNLVNMDNPTPEQTVAILSKTGHIEIAADCYRLQLMRIDWTK